MSKDSYGWIQSKVSRKWHFFPASLLVSECGAIWIDEDTYRNPEAPPQKERCKHCDREVNRMKRVHGKLDWWNE